MRWVFRIGIGLLVAVVLLVVVFVVVVGPWPTYGSVDVTEQDYYKKAIADISAQVQESTITDTPGRLQAGWADANITPAVGTPLGGYGARGMEHHSTGVRDRLEVKVLVLSDGDDTLALVGADILITPPNVAAGVREAVAAQVPLTPDDILFNASHTHCGPGSLGPGLAMRVTGAQFMPEVPEMLIREYTAAIVEAYSNMEPAKLAHGGVDAPQFIRNRVRDAVTDSELSYAVLEQDDGDRSFLVSYSAHPTVFGSRMMEFSAEYPGELRRKLERETDAYSVYLGGAVGSMGPRAPEGPTDEARVVAMGQALADLIIEDAQDLTFEDRLDIVSVGVKLDMPEPQVRPFEDNTHWRVSPIIARIAFSPFEMNGWMHGARVGDLLFMGLPSDFSGEISVDWKAYAAEQGYDLWTLSFCGTYCGYFSPDKYYNETPLGYETGLMSWFGPNIEAHFTGLYKHMFEEMTAGVAAPDARG